MRSAAAAAFGDSYVDLKNITDSSESGGRAAVTQILDVRSFSFGGSSDELRLDWVR